ncbi:MAG: adenylyltransferase/cytidyltransferase family protein, partial [Spirochaetales bacterium]|nr:adenylyltransferase/cytidyltransferase family protein [Spirochaetales bacterium]
MGSVMETAMVGGSFDPIHRGHLHLIHTVASRSPYRRFILVPVSQNH